MRLNFANTTDGNCEGIIDQSLDDDCTTDSRPSSCSRRDSGFDNNCTDQLVAKETKAVLKLRVAVIFVLIACATAVACTIYHLTHSSEVDEFEIQFEGASEKVLKAFQDVLLIHAGALSSLTVAITTQGKFTRSTKRYFCIPFHSLFKSESDRNRSKGSVAVCNVEFVPASCFRYKKFIWVNLSGNESLCGRITAKGMGNVHRIG
jgi:hypothetical protein